MSDGLRLDVAAGSSRTNLDDALGGVARDDRHVTDSDPPTETMRLAVGLGDIVLL